MGRGARRGRGSGSSIINNINIEFGDINPGGKKAKRAGGGNFDFDPNFGPGRKKSFMANVAKKSLAGAAATGAVGVAINVFTGQFGDVINELGDLAKCVIGQDVKDEDGKSSCPSPGDAITGLLSAVGSLVFLLLVIYFGISMVMSISSTSTGPRTGT